jgi:hypothetical protein
MRGSQGDILRNDRLILAETLAGGDAENAESGINLPHEGSCVSHFGILHCALMDVSAFEDVTCRAIGKELGISDRMAQATSKSAKVIPEVEGLAVEEERLCDVVVRDEPAESEMERLAPIVVFGQPGPAVGPAVRRSQK